MVKSNDCCMKSNAPKSIIEAFLRQNFPIMCKPDEEGRDVFFIESTIVLPMTQVEGVYRIRAYIKRVHGKEKPIGIEDLVNNLAEYRSKIDYVTIIFIRVRGKHAVIFTDKDFKYVLGLLREAVDML